MMVWAMISDDGHVWHMLLTAMTTERAPVAKKACFLQPSAGLMLDFWLVSYLSGCPNRPPQKCSAHWWCSIFSWDRFTHDQQGHGWCFNGSCAGLAQADDELASAAAGEPAAGASWWQPGCVTQKCWILYLVLLLVDTHTVVNDNPALFCFTYISDYWLYL